LPGGRRADPGTAAGDHHDPSGEILHTVILAPAGEGRILATLRLIDRLPVGNPFEE